jgi:GTPase SAR1 family protein
MLLVGNKCDLESMREVGVEDASNYAQQNNVSFLESSALNNHNVGAAFLHLIAGKFQIYLLHDTYFFVRNL